MSFQPMLFYTISILLLLVFRTVGSAEKKSLSCITTKKVIYDTFPKFTLYGDEKTLNYDSTDVVTIGKPTCVIFFGHNKTHSGTWQGHVSSFALPLGCHMATESSTNCFQSPNQFTFLEIKKGFLCCCSSDNCNMDNPKFFQMFDKEITKSVLLNKIKPFCRYFFCIMFILLFVVLEAVLETLIFGKLFGSEKKKTEALPPKDIKTVVETPSPGEVLRDVPSSLKVQKTQPSSKSNSKKTKKVSEMSVKPEKPNVEVSKKPSLLEVDKTQEDDVDSLKKKSELQVMSTQLSEDSEKLTLPPKPEAVLLANGRLQKTSMNYEESTYSDLD